MLWVAFAKFYEENGQIEDSRVIMEKGTLVEYTRVDDLASVWCEWAEMEIRNEYVLNFFVVLIIKSVCVMIL